MNGALTVCLLVVGLLDKALSVPVSEQGKRLCELLVPF